MLDIQFFVNFVGKFNQYIQENKDYLTELDSAIGDADHGINMSKGCKAAIEKIEKSNFNSVSEMLRAVSMTLMSSVGGASGPLYGTVFMKMALTLNKENIDLKNLSDALVNALNGIKSLGKAQLKDKTMVDVWEPVTNEFRFLVNKNKPLSDIKNEMIALAKNSMESTIPLMAKKGRASYLGERSIGHQDPGATSSYFFFKALFESLG